MPADTDSERIVAEVEIKSYFNLFPSSIESNFSTPTMYRTIKQAMALLEEPCHYSHDDGTRCEGIDDCDPCPACQRKAALLRRYKGE